MLFIGNIKKVGKVSISEYEDKIVDSQVEIFVYEKPLSSQRLEKT